MFLQGVDIQQNVKNEIRINGNSLVLRSVKKESMGNYSCVASNVEGDKKSNSFELRVSCKYYCIICCTCTVNKYKYTLRSS